MSDAEDNRSKLDELRRSKSRLGSRLKRTRNKLQDAIEDEDKGQVRNLRDDVVDLEEELKMVIEDTIDVHRATANETAISDIVSELSDIESDNRFILSAAAKYLASKPSVASSEDADIDSKTAKCRDVGRDLWKQLQRVHIPTFSGDKMAFESWRAAFEACVDKAPATAENKLLQLRQSLQGEALRSIEGLGHSAAAYEIAKERLVRKYGGQRRQLMKYISELRDFRPMKWDNLRELEKFADLLDIAAANLKTAGLESELRNGMTYAICLSKLTESLAAEYHKWYSESGEDESVLTLRLWVLQQVEFRSMAMEDVNGLRAKGGDVFGNREHHRVQRQSTNRSYFQSSSTKGCQVCLNQHPLWKCTEFKGMSVDKRRDFVKENKLCFMCLLRGHEARQCKWTRPCGLDGCRGKHNQLLHLTSADDNDAERRQSRTIQHSLTKGEHAADNDAAQNETSQTTTHHVSGSNDISFRTVPAIVKGRNKSMKVTVILDDASSASYINEDIAAELGLEGPSRNMTVNVVNGGNEHFWSKEVEFKICSEDGRRQYEISALTTTKVVGNLLAVPWNVEKVRWDHLRTIPFPNVTSRQKIDILIGADYTELHRCYKEIPGRANDPIARLTPLGWTCVGPIGRDYACPKSRIFFTYFGSSSKSNSELDNILRKFWELENCTHPKSSLSIKEEAIVESTRQSMKFIDGHYQVAVPWKHETPIMPNSYDSAMRRLECTEKKLLKNSTVAKSYQMNIADYVKKGYIRKLSSDEVVESPTKWLLPHFPVIRMDKETTKVRMVFDAAAKVDGFSLNDVIETGPNLQQNLFAVLLRFRKHDVALVCDISEMYMQIRIPEEDQPYFRFLWREMSQDKIPDLYQFSRVVFGMNASPFLAQFVSHEHARKLQETFPQASETILHSTYMDDSMDSRSTVQEAIQLYNELNTVWQSAGMKPRKWLSNRSDVISVIPKEDRAASVDIVKDSLPQQKALGIMWQSSDDYFVFNGSAFDDEPLSKRSLLRRVATLFDPLGFLAPFSVVGRILIQQVWSAGLDWDDAFPSDIDKKARKWSQEFENLQDIQIARSLDVQDDTVLHTFVDASMLAYGAVSYVRSTSSHPSPVRMVAAKVKVAPLKSVSIPRLELAAAVCGLRLALHICSIYGIDSSKMVLWSDSMNVLCWIRRCSREFKPFVANRIGEIQTSTSPSQWKYVPSKQNPADLLTRGLSVSELKESKLWWSGPAFLMLQEEEWPHTPIESNPEESERRKTASKSTSMVYMYYGMPSMQRGSIPIEELYSNLQKLIRVQAWITRFVSNARTAVENRAAGELSSDELYDAEIIIIRAAQQRAFKEDYQLLVKGKQVSRQSCLLKLNPKIDDDGLIRIDGRLRNADYLPYQARHPIILPRNDTYTRLVVKKYHEDCYHGGTNQTMAMLAQKFWIIAGREAVRSWENECSTCKKNRKLPATQIMAPLPRCRIEQSLRAFSHTAVDFGGPYLTKQGRGKQRAKRYLCLFTCLATRAVHIEIAYGLDTDTFLNAFARMTGRRGLPLEVFSDNGTNFKAADVELRDLVKKLDQSQLQKSLANRGIKWNFNPPGGPHFGGAHESMIKSAKRAIKSVIANAEITDEELTTIFVGVESLLNSRPITYQTANHLDPEPLTPNHFLHGMVGGQFAPESVDTTEFPMTKRWRRVQELIRHVWKRWLREYIPTLQPRQKWNSTNRNFAIGDVSNRILREELGHLDA